MSEPTTPTGARLLNYHRSYKGRCGVHEDELAPMVAEAEAEAAQQARALADELGDDLAVIHEMCKPESIDMSGTPRWFDGGTPAGGGSRERIWRICDAALAKWEASRVE